MTKGMTLISGLALLVLASLGFAAEPLSEESLDKITAQGQELKTQEPSTMRPTSTVGSNNQSHTNLTIQSQSQTHLRAGTVNNAAGLNQIANGINVR